MTELDPSTNRSPSGRRRGPSARIAQLSVLPIFMKLKARRVIVTGGGAPSAWKAELASAAGAHVVVYAEEVGNEMAALAARPASEGFGRIELVPRNWSIGDLSNSSLLIGDAATEGEAWALRCAGREAGVPVNVIDKPSWCDFQFSTIVNRSPVVIAISTDGAAPIVGQAVRQRIEAILGPALGSWAKLAERIRPIVNEKLDLGPERRSFWQRFARRVFGPAPGPDFEIDLVSEIETLRTEKPGAKILLVGTGPLSMSGTTGLTLGAVAALQSADRILHAANIPDTSLELARRAAERDSLTLADMKNPEALVAAVARATANSQTVALVLAGDPASQWPELTVALADLAADMGVDFDILPALGDPSMGSGAAYLQCLRQAYEDE